MLKEGLSYITRDKCMLFKQKIEGKTNLKLNDTKQNKAQC